MRKIATGLVALALTAGIGCAVHEQTASTRHARQAVQREYPAGCEFPVFGCRSVRGNDSYEYLVCTDSSRNHTAFVNPMDSDEWREVEYDPYFSPGGEVVQRGDGLRAYHLQGRQE